MKRNWVKFCEHAIQSDWKPDAVGEKTNPDSGNPKFGSVPVVRCKSTNQGIMCVRLDKDGNWVEHKRRARSLSPVKPNYAGQFYGHGDLRRLVPQAQECPMASFPVRNRCDAHILEHMRCSCAACMNFANQWRCALKHKMRAAAAGEGMAALTDTKPKPRRWTCKIGGRTRPCPDLDKPIPCPVELPECRQPGFRWPYVGSPRVNWWYGNYVPCDDSSDDYAEYDCDNCDEEEDSDNDYGDVNNWHSSKLRRKNRVPESCKRRFRRGITFRENKGDDDGPLCVEDLRSGEGSFSSAQEHSDSSTQRAHCTETRVAFKRRETRAKLWSNNALTGAECGRNLKTTQRKPGQRAQGPPKHRYRAESVEPAYSSDNFHTMDNPMSYKALADHFRTVTCTDPASKTLSTRECLNNELDGGVRPRRVRDMSSSKGVERDPPSSTEFGELDRSANNGEKGRNGSPDRSKRERLRKAKTPKRKKSEDRTFMSEDLRRNVEKILQREANFQSQEEMGERLALAKSNRKRMPGRRRRSTRKSAPNSRNTSMDREVSDTSETTKLLRKYGVGDAIATRAVNLGHGEFVQKDDQGFYYVNAGENPDQISNPEESQHKPAAQYKSNFINHMGWGGHELGTSAYPRFCSRSRDRKPDHGDGERTSNGWDDGQRLGARKKEWGRGRDNTGEIQDHQSPIYNTIKIVQGNSFWEEVWNKLSRNLTKEDTGVQEAVEREGKQDRSKSSINAKGWLEDELRDLSPNNSFIEHNPSAPGSLPRDLIGETLEDNQGIIYPKEPARQKQWERKVEKNDSRSRMRDHASVEREQIHEKKTRSKKGSEKNKKSDNFKASKTQIKTDGERLDTGHKSSNSRHTLFRGSSPQSPNDRQRFDTIEESEQPGSEIPSNLDKDRVLISPWDGDKLSDIIKSRDKKRPDRGVSYTIIRHEKGKPKRDSGRGYSDDSENGENDDDNNGDGDDDEDFMTASIGSRNDDRHYSRSRSASYEGESRRSSRPRKTAPQKGYSSCKYDNLLPGDDDYIMAAQTSATSVTSSRLDRGEKGMRRNNYVSDSSNSASHMDDTRNCLAAKKKNLTLSSLGTGKGGGVRGGQYTGGTSCSYNQRSRSPAAGGYRNRSANKQSRSGKQKFTDSKWPYLPGFFGGSNSPSPKNCVKTPKKSVLNPACYPETLNSRAGRNPSSSSRPQSPSSGVKVNTKRDNFQSRPRGLCEYKPVSYPLPSKKPPSGDTESPDRARSRKWEQKSVGSSTVSRPDVSINGPREGSEDTVGESMYRKSLHGDALETINIRRPLEPSKNRRPLIEVNIFGPLDGDGESVDIQRSRYAQSQTTDDDRTYEEEKLDPSQDKEECEVHAEDSDNSDGCCKYICGRCCDWNESTNHPHFTSEKGIAGKQTHTEKTNKRKGFHNGARKPPLIAQGTNHKRQPLKKRNKEVALDENSSKAKPKLISSSQQTEHPFQPDESMNLPTFSFITTDIPVPRTEAAHQNRKTDSSTKRMGTENAQKNVAMRGDYDKQKSTKKIEGGDAQYAINYGSTDHFSRKRVGKVDFKPFIGAVSPKNNTKVTATKPRSSSGGEKQLGVFTQAQTRGKPTPLISIPTGHIETDLKPRSRSLSACRANTRANSGSKLRSSCYPFYNYDYNEDLKKGDTTYRQKTDNKRPFTSENDYEFKSLGKTRGIIPTWKTKKYPETIWHKYVKLERDNLNWSNKFTELRGVKDKDPTLGNCTTKKKVNKVEEVLQPQTCTKEMRVVANKMKEIGANVTVQNATADTNKGNTPKKVASEDKVAKFKKPRCINIRDDACFDGWSLCYQQQDDSNSGSESTTKGSECSEQRVNKTWNHAIGELAWPIAGHRIDYRGDLVSSNPTARMVDEPILATAPSKDDDIPMQPDGFSREDDTKDATRLPQNRSRPPDIKQPNRLDQQTDRDNTDVGYHRNQSRERRPPPHRRKSCCGSSRVRKRSEKSISSTSSSTSPDTSGHQRRRPSKLSTTFSGRRRLQKSRNPPKKAACRGSNDISTPAPPPSLRSNISNVPSPLAANVQNTRLSHSKRNQNRHSTQTYKKITVSGDRHNGKHSESSTECQTEDSVCSTSSSDDDRRTRVQPKAQRIHHNGSKNDSFRAARRVLGEPRPISEPQWENQHASLMGDCSEENISNSWRRMHRIETKAKHLEGSMSKLKLNFGDIETRLDKVQVIQQDYMSRAEEAVEMLRERRGRSRSRRRQQCTNNSRSNNARPASSDVYDGEKDTPVKIEIPKDSKRADKIGPYAKNKREGTFICIKPSTEIVSNLKEVADSGGERHLCKNKPRTTGNHKNVVQEGRNCKKSKAEQEYGMLRFMKDITEYMDQHAKMSKSRPRSNDGRPGKDRIIKCRDSDNRDRDITSSGGKRNTPCQQINHHMKEESLDLNIPLNDEHSKKASFTPKRRRSISSKRDGSRSRACSVTTDRSANNSNREQRSWSSILAAYKTWVKQSSSAYSDTEGSWSGQESSQKSTEEEVGTSQDYNASWEVSFSSDQKLSTNNDPECASLKSEENQRDSKQGVQQHKLAWDDSDTKVNEKTSDSEKFCSCPKCAHDIINKLSDLLQNVFITNSDKKHSKSSKVFANTNKCLSKVYARPAQSSVSAKTVNSKTKLPHLFKNHSQILKELDKYRKAFEDSVYAQKVSLRSRSATPCSRRLRSLSGSLNSERKPLTYTQLYHDRKRYERSPSRLRPTTASGIPRLEMIDRANLDIKSIDRFPRQYRDETLGRNRNVSRKLALGGQCIKSEKDIKGKYSGNRKPLRQLHVHLPQDEWLPDPFSSARSQGETCDVNRRRKQQQMFSKVKSSSYGVSGIRFIGRANRRSRKSSRVRWNSHKSFSKKRSLPLDNIDGETHYGSFDTHALNGLDYTLTSPPPPPSSPASLRNIEQSNTFTSFSDAENSGEYSTHLLTGPNSQIYGNNDCRDFISNPSEMTNTTALKSQSLTTHNLRENNRSSCNDSAFLSEGQEFLRDGNQQVRTDGFNCVHGAGDLEGQTTSNDQESHIPWGGREYERGRDYTTVNERKLSKCLNNPASQNSPFVSSNNCRDICRYQLQNLQERSRDVTPSIGDEQRGHAFVSNFLRSIANEIGIDVAQTTGHSLTLRSSAPIHVEQNDPQMSGSHGAHGRDEEYTDKNHSALEGEYQGLQKYKFVNNRYPQNYWIQEDKELQRSLDRSVQNIPDNPISDTDEGGLSGSTNRVRFAEPISHVTEQPQAVSDYTSGRWRRLTDTKISLALLDKSPSAENKPEKDPWENTRRVLDFLDRKDSGGDCSTFTVSNGVKHDTLPPPARTESGDTAPLSRRHGHTDLTRLKDLPPSPSRLLSARQQRTPNNVIVLLRRSDDSGCETSYDIDTDSTHC